MVNGKEHEKAPNNLMRAFAKPVFLKNQNSEKCLA